MGPTHLTGATPLVPPTCAKVDSRSEKNIATLHPAVQPFARALVHDAAEVGITIKVISGTRTYDEQNALYAQGRTKPGKIVTQKPGGYSNHNFGLAFDIGVFQLGKYVEESPEYKKVGLLGMKRGLEWGGSWTFVDEPHFQLIPLWAKGLDGESALAALRDRLEQERDLFA